MIATRGGKSPSNLSPQTSKAKNSVTSAKPKHRLVRFSFGLAKRAHNAKSEASVSIPNFASESVQGSDSAESTQSTVTPSYQEQAPTSMPPPLPAQTQSIDSIAGKWLPTLASQR